MKTIHLLCPTWCRWHVIDRAYTAALLAARALAASPHKFWMLHLHILDDSPVSGQIHVPTTPWNLTVSVTHFRERLTVPAKLNRAAQLSHFTTSKARRKDLYCLWDDDDFHLPRKLVDLLDTFMLHAPQSAIHKQHFYVTGAHPKWTAELIDRPHPNSGLYRCGEYVEVPWDCAIAYDQWLMNTHNAKTGLTEGCGIGYYWGGRYHLSASPQKRMEDHAAWFTQEYSSKDHALTRNDDDEAIIQLLEHMSRHPTPSPLDSADIDPSRYRKCPSCGGMGRCATLSTRTAGLKGLIPRAIESASYQCPVCAGLGHVIAQAHPTAAGE